MAGYARKTALGPVEVLDPNWHPVPDAEVVWSTADGKVATATDAGLLTGVGNGSTTVRASFGELVDFVCVSIRQVPADVRLVPAYDTIRFASFAASHCDGRRCSQVPPSWRRPITPWSGLPRHSSTRRFAACPHPAGLCAGSHRSQPILNSIAPPAAPTCDSVKPIIELGCVRRTKAFVVVPIEIR